jgi:hemolysin activation/secretion protein
MTFALLTFSSGVYAAPPPSAGNQIQQIPQSPTLQKVEPETRVERAQAPTILVTDTEKITVNSLHISGQTLFSEDELIRVTGFSAGKEVNLNELRLMANRITDYYHQKGYFVAKAYLPEQQIKDGVVKISVIEGRYGRIILQNTSNLSNKQANGILAELHSGDVINSAKLENSLLLLSDISGVNVKSTLVPGSSVGTSDLIVDITPGPLVSGSVDADNAGDRYTGEYRYGATINFNNLAGQGDVASLRVLSTFDGLNYERAAYQMQFGKATGGVAYSHLNYHLGKEFSSLDANGTANIASVYGSYPLIRSRQSNLYAQLGYDHRTFQDRIDSIPTVTDKKDDVVMATLLGNHNDDIGGGGLSAFSLTLSAGKLNIETPVARADDDATARTNGSYDKLGFYDMRLQNITNTLSLYGAVSGQFASKNLDSSEQMSLGGMYGVRAYPVGEAYGDEGFLATLEARQLLPSISKHQLGQLYLIGFVDTGTVTLHHNPWDNSENHRTLSGVGVGFNWLDYNDFSVKCYYARKLGNEKATSAPDADGRFWVQLVKYF